MTMGADRTFAELLKLPAGVTMAKITVSVPSQALLRLRCVTCARDVGETAVTPNTPTEVPPGWFAWVASHDPAHAFSLLTDKAEAHVQVLFAT